MKVGRDNEETFSSFKAGFGCYPPGIFFHPVPGGVTFLQTTLISELCTVPWPQSGARSNCCFPSSASEGHWKSQHSPCPDKAPGFQLCKPVWVGQGVFPEQHCSVLPCRARGLRWLPWRRAQSDLWSRGTTWHEILLEHCRGRLGWCQFRTWDCNNICPRFNFIYYVQKPLFEWRNGQGNMNWEEPRNSKQSPNSFCLEI